ncbi:hypothetical protein V7024_20030 [Bacillus sp. JJ864]|uniref:hypothetical protein n=1 Tax=Bacillus sp. JJ864 TaxID=3122975 RepID=UPI002FFD90DC
MENEKVAVSVEIDGKKTTIKQPVHEKMKIVVVINNQFTNAPNTTQIASGAGRSSAAGNNAALDSSNTEQQESVGAEGKAKNEGMQGKQREPHEKDKKCCVDNEIVIVLNNQIHLTDDNNTSETESTSSATQVASGGGTYSASGTNSAIESSNTKQQFSVGGSKGSLGFNSGMNSDQIEESSKSFNKKQQLSDDGPKLFIS